MLEFLIIFFLSFLPFQFALQPVAGIDLAVARLLAIFIFLVWLTTSLLRRQLFLPAPFILFIFSGFLLLALGSVFWAEQPAWALRKSAFLLSFFPLFLVFSSALRNAAFYSQALRALVIGATGAAFFALLQFFLQFFVGVERLFAFWVSGVLPFFLGQAFAETVSQYPSLLVNLSGATVMRASGFFPDPHMAAFFFGMTLPLAVLQAWKSAPPHRKFWIACALIIFLADLFTFSRGGYVGLISGATFVFFLLVTRVNIRKKIKAVIMIAVFLSLGILLSSPIGERFFSSFSSRDYSATERIRLWQEAARVVQEYPLLGVGLGNYPLIVKPTATYREPIYAHNLFLDIALETGLLGLAFFIALLGVALRSAWRGWSARGEARALALCVTLIIFTGHALFETPIFSVHILPLFLFVLAASLQAKQASPLSSPS